MTAADRIDEARLGLLLGDLRLPGIKHIWPHFAERADKGERAKGRRIRRRFERARERPAAVLRTLAALAEHEIAERGRRRIERHLAEARLLPGKSLDSFDFEAVPFVGETVHRTVS